MIYEYDRYTVSILQTIFDAFNALYLIKISPRVLDVIIESYSRLF